MEATLATRKLVYKEHMQMTEGVDFGIDLASTLAGKVPIPPEGVRVDQGFTGELEGPRLKGTIVGTDYLDIRADGLVILHVHGVITTNESKKISFFADGTASFEAGKPDGTVRENVRLHSAEPDYAWVNKVMIWATGKVDLASGSIAIEGYES